MCLIFVAWRCHARHRLVVAANRDEYHARPAAPAHWWDDAPGVLAGRDLEAGGTWLGIGPAGRFAAITNYRDPFAKRLPGAPSRGALVGDFVAGDEPAQAYLGRVMEEGHRYNGFSLLAMDGDGLAFASNRSRGVIRLDPGVYGLSNHLLDTPWPKVTGGKAELERLLAGPEVRVSELLALLAPDDPRHDEAPAADTESDPGRMRWRTSRFIIGPDYGTRASAAVLLDAGGAGVFVERSFDASGAAVGDVAFELGAEGVRPIGETPRSDPGSSRDREPPAPVREGGASASWSCPVFVDGSSLGAQSADW